MASKSDAAASNEAAESAAQLRGEVMNSNYGQKPYVNELEI